MKVKQLCICFELPSRRLPLHLVGLWSKYILLLPGIKYLTRFYFQADLISWFVWYRTTITSKFSLKIIHAGTLTIDPRSNRGRNICASKQHLSILKSVDIYDNNLRYDLCIINNIIAELAERSPIIKQNRSNPSSRKNLDVRPYKVLLLTCVVNCAAGTPTPRLCSVVQWSVHWAPSRTTWVLVLAGARRCALETCGKKMQASLSGLAKSIYLNIEEICQNYF